MKNPIAHKNGTGASDRKRLEDRFGNSKPGGRQARQFPCGEIDPLALGKAVAVVAGSGDAIMFALTRDGGCMVITILSGDDRKKFYPDDVRSFHFALDQICVAYGAPAGAGLDPFPDEKIG